MSLAVEKRIWPFVNPMEQFGSSLSVDLLHNLSRWADELSPAELSQYNAKDLGALIHMNHIHGARLLELAKQFPHAGLSARVRPLTSELLRIQVEAVRGFEWSTKLHGQREPFWLWVQDEEGSKILQFTRVSFVGENSGAGGNSSGGGRSDRVGKEDNGGRRANGPGPSGPKLNGSPTYQRKRSRVGTTSSRVLRADFMIPLRAVTGPNKSLTIRLISDRWVGATEELSVSLQGIKFPERDAPPTPVLNLPFLPLKAISLPRLEEGMRRRSIPTLNGLQTQAFYMLAQTVQNVLLAGPSANGKSTLVLAAIW